MVAFVVVAPLRPFEVLGTVVVTVSVLVRVLRPIRICLEELYHSYGLPYLVEGVTVTRKKDEQSLLPLAFLETACDERAQVSFPAARGGAGAILTLETGVANTRWASGISERSAPQAQTDHHRCQAKKPHLRHLQPSLTSSRVVSRCRGGGDKREEKMTELTTACPISLGPCHDYNGSRPVSRSRLWDSQNRFQGGNLVSPECHSHVLNPVYI